MFGTRRGLFQAVSGAALGSTVLLTVAGMVGIVDSVLASLLVSVGVLFATAVGLVGGRERRR